MKYNFDEVIDRSNNRSSKYDERLKKFGTEDVIPLWVADMDFKTAQPIIDACKESRRGSGDILPDRQATLKQYRNGKKNIMAGSLKLPT